MDRQEEKLVTAESTCMGQKTVIAANVSNWAEYKILKCTHVISHNILLNVATHSCTCPRSSDNL